MLSPVKTDSNSIDNDPTCYSGIDDSYDTQNYPSSLNNKSKAIRKPEISGNKDATKSTTFKMQRHQHIAEEKKFATSSFEEDCRLSSPSNFEGPANRDCILQHASKRAGTDYAKKIKQSSVAAVSASLSSIGKSGRSDCIENEIMDMQVVARIVGSQDLSKPMSRIQGSKRIVSNSNCEVRVVGNHDRNIEQDVKTRKTHGSIHKIKSQDGDIVKKEKKESGMRKNTDEICTSKRVHKSIKQGNSVDSFIPFMDEDGMENENEKESEKNDLANQTSTQIPTKTPDTGYYFLTRTYTPEKQTSDQSSYQPDEGKSVYLKDQLLWYTPQKKFVRHPPLQIINKGESHYHSSQNLTYTRESQLSNVSAPKRSQRNRDNSTNSNDVILLYKYRDGKKMPVKTRQNMNPGKHDDDIRIRCECQSPEEWRNSQTSSTSDCPVYDGEKVVRSEHHHSRSSRQEKSSAHALRITRSANFEIIIRRRSRSCATGSMGRRMLSCQLLVVDTKKAEEERSINNSFDGNQQSELFDNEPCCYINHNIIANEDPHNPCPSRYLDDEKDHPRIFKLNKSVERISHDADLQNNEDVKCDIFTLNNVEESLHDSEVNIVGGIRSADQQTQVEHSDLPHVNHDINTNEDSHLQAFDKCNNSDRVMVESCDDTVGDYSLVSDDHKPSAVFHDLAASNYETIPTVSHETEMIVWHTIYANERPSPRILRPPSVDIKDDLLSSPASPPSLLVQYLNSRLRTFDTLEPTNEFLRDEFTVTSDTKEMTVKLLDTKKAVPYERDIYVDAKRRDDIVLVTSDDHQHQCSPLITPATRNSYVVPGSISDDYESQLLSSGMLAL